MKRERDRDNCCEKRVRYREKPMWKTSLRLDRTKQGIVKGGPLCHSLPVFVRVCCGLQHRKHSTDPEINLYSLLFKASDILSCIFKIAIAVARSKTILRSIIGYPF